jgi:hypothetical protein
MDSLTVTSTQQLIPAEKIKDKRLDQMTLPERADLLKQAYEIIESAADVTDEEMEVISKMETSVEQKIASWGLIIKKASEAAELCGIEEKHYKEKAELAKERGEKFNRKIESMSEYLKQKMIELNIKKVETPSFTVSLKKKRKSIIIGKDADLESPERKDMVKVEVSRKWDKIKIKEILDSGKALKTAEFSKPDFTVSIK